MQKIIVAVLLCSVLCLSHSFEASSPLNKVSNTFRRLDEYATTSGEIPLTLGDLGFFVHVDFSDYRNLTSAPADNDSDYGNMVIALYTDKTFFGLGCQGFQSYCDKHGDTCSEITGENQTSVFPYFKSNSSQIKPEVYLDYNHWFLQSTAFVSNECKGYYPLAGSGFIGMGVSQLSLPNFNGINPNFAVHISKNLSHGTFEFNVDMSKAKSDTPKATLTTDNLWHVSKVDSIDMKKKNFDANASLIFDLGTDSIGLPKRLYDQVLKAVEDSPTVGKCSVGDDFRPTCEFTGDIRHLPSIKLNIGDEQLEIPPEVYVVQTQNTTFYYDPIMLKIKSLSTDASEGLNVTSEYENYIILGYPVMSYYYTVFEAGQSGQGTVKLYLSGDYVSASSLTWIFIVAGLLGFLLIGATFYIFEKKYRKNREASQPLLEDVKIRGQGKRIRDVKA